MPDSKPSNTRPKDAASAPADDQDDTTGTTLVLKRDYIIFGVAILFISAGLTDGLYRGFDLPIWAAIALGATFWAGAEYMIYQKYQQV